MEVAEEDTERKYPARKRTSVAPAPGTASPGARYQQETLLPTSSKIPKMDRIASTPKKIPAAQSRKPVSLSTVKNLAKQKEDLNKNLTDHPHVGLNPFARLWRCQLTLKNVFPCCECGRLLASAEALHHHEEMHQNMGRNETTIQSSNTKTKVNSPVKPPKTENTLSRTLNSSNGSKSHQFYCGTCCQPFSSQTALNRHFTREIHLQSVAKFETTNKTSEGKKNSDSSPLPSVDSSVFCTLCQLSVASKASFRRHLQSVAHKERESTKEPSNSHMDGAAVKQRPNKVVLPVPNSVLPQEMSPNSGSPLTCAICQKSFSTKSNHKRHYLSHLKK